MNKPIPSKGPGLTGASCYRAHKARNSYHKPRHRHPNSCGGTVRSIVKDADEWESVCKMQNLKVDALDAVQLSDRSGES